MKIKIILLITLFANAATVGNKIKKYILFNKIAIASVETNNTEKEEKNIDVWNKKVITWLTDYNVTNVKKIILGKKGEAKYEEITCYTKKSKAGNILFVVEVNKKLNPIYASELYFESGVRIAQKDSQPIDYYKNNMGMLYKKYSSSMEIFRNLRSKKPTIKNYFSKNFL